MNVHHSIVKLLTGALLAFTLLAGCTTPFPLNENESLDDPEIRIHTIQGADLVSPMEGQTVQNIPGIVTAFSRDGFYMQDPRPDDNPATSEGIFVSTTGVPRARPGDGVAVTGQVQEYVPGGNESNNQPITRIVNARVEILSSANNLPDAAVVGSGGRIPPKIIEDDDGRQFDPDQDALDFYESLESMLVKVNTGTVVGATNGYGETVIVPTESNEERIFTPRGGLLLQPDGLNPQRILIDDGLLPLPVATTGDLLVKPLVGIMDYSFGNYKVQPIQPVVWRSSKLTPEQARPVEAGELLIATYNVDNLSAVDDRSRFTAFANQIVDRLQSPDILVLEEVQDNNGNVDDGTVDANLTYRTLIDEIAKLGGPKYYFRDIPPENNQDGGEEGGNIRVGFIYRTDRGLEFIDRPGKPDQGVRVEQDSNGIHLSHSPARLLLATEAFFNSRKPLVGEFRYEGRPIYIIGAHLNSKGTDTAVYGWQQPPQELSSSQRLQQAIAINRLVQNILAADSNAAIVIAGDMNDFQFSKVVTALKGTQLTNAIELLPDTEQYTFVFEGNSQVLDHILVSNTLAQKISAVDVVHINAEFPVRNRQTDHDPVLLYLKPGTP